MIIMKRLMSTKNLQSDSVNRRRESIWRTLGPAIVISLLLHHSVLTVVPVPRIEDQGTHNLEVAYLGAEDSEKKVETDDLDAFRKRARLPKKIERPVPKEKPPKPDPGPDEKKPDEKKSEEKKPLEIPDITGRHFIDQQYDKDDEPPPDARYLDTHDRRVAEESRAMVTTLLETGDGPEETGDEGKDQKSDEAREAEDERQGRPEDQARRTRREDWQEFSPETGETMDTEPDGERIPFPHTIPGPKGEDGVSRPLNLKLSWNAFEREFGGRMAEERRSFEDARTRQVRQGTRADRMAKIKAALENFTPDVRPGNQTALNARRHPFAQYITRIHRTIHRYWGSGVLVLWSRTYGSDHPLNDYSRWTKVEFEIKDNGEVDDIKVIRPSGNTVYDVAAVESILSSSPFLPPPEILLSYDRRVYIHWRMDRNHRQCGVWNAEPFILEGPPDERLD